MKTFEVQVFEQKNFPKDYGRIPTDAEMNGSYDDWDVIKEEMQKRPNQKFLRYKRFSTWIPDCGTYHYPGNRLGGIATTTEPLDIPTGTLREFLKIYTEDR